MLLNISFFLALAGSHAHPARAQEPPKVFKNFEQMMDLLPREVMDHLVGRKAKEAAAKGNEVFEEKLVGQPVSLDLKVNSWAPQGAEQTPTLVADQIRHLRKGRVSFTGVARAHFTEADVAKAAQLKKGAPFHVEGKIGWARVFGYDDGASIQIVIEEGKLKE